MFSAPFRTKRLPLPISEGWADPFDAPCARMKMKAPSGGTLAHRAAATLARPDSPSSAPLGRSPAGAERPVESGARSAVLRPRLAPQPRRGARLDGSRLGRLPELGVGPAHQRADRHRLAVGSGVAVRDDPPGAVAPRLLDR